MSLPHRIAVLCYLYDPDERLLLLHRRRQPNAGMYSPIGGKLEVARGETPHACAVREIREETGLEIDLDEVRLAGLVAETAYEGQNHWLIFLFEVTRPIAPEEIIRMDFDEGQLEWVPMTKVADLGIPESDRLVMWPLVQQHRGGFFAVDIDCRDGGMRWALRESRMAWKGQGLRD